MSTRLRNIVEKWFETPAERQWVASLCAATVLHSALVILLLFLVLGEHDTGLAVELESGWEQPDGLVEFTELPVLETEVNPHAGGSAAPPSRAVTDPVVRVSPEHVVDRGEVPARAGTARGHELLVSYVHGETDPGAGRGNGTGTGVGDGDAGGFFGMNVPGRNFVYVVDASSSMYSPHDSEAKTRFGRVQVELVRSIGAMSPQQSFFVVFFNSMPHPMPANAMQFGEPSTKQRFLDWTARFRAGGDTNPLPALRIALALRPDVVYFLTDGVLPRGQNVIREITGLNRGAVRIHTFAFGSQAGEKLMQELAERNGGKYHYVP